MPMARFKPFPTLLAALVVLLPACSPEAAAEDEDTEQVTRATVASGKVDVEGGIISVAARRPGVVSEVFVEEGDLVRKGQVLARLEDHGAMLEVRQGEAALGAAKADVDLARANLQTAEREVDRFERLVDRGFVAGQKMDQMTDAVVQQRAALKARLSNARRVDADLAQASYNQELTYVRAPVDGRIVRRYVSPGSGASTLNVSTMFGLEPMANRIVRAEVTERALPSVKVGQGVQLYSEYNPARTYAGKVKRIAAIFGARRLDSEQANQKTDERVVEVIISVDALDLLIGQRVMVKFSPVGAKGT
jgi:HlyD family secretion protein